MSVNYTPNFSTPTPIRGFKMWCQKVLPLVYDDSLSYYEVLCKVTAYLNDVIEHVNMANDNIESLREAYNKLQEYVNNYFDNLDVQDEINKKLDIMANDGTLDRIINQSIFGGIRNDITNLKNNKTNNSDFNVLKARVDAIESGSSADPNAELIDIRVMYDGNTASSAGEAVRTQISNARIAGGSYSSFYNNTANINIDTVNAVVTVGSNVGICTQRGFVFVPAGSVNYTKQTGYEAIYYCTYDYSTSTVNIAESLTAMNASSVILFAFYGNSILMCDYNQGNFTINGNTPDPKTMHKAMTAYVTNGVFEVFIGENSCQVNATWPLITNGKSFFLDSTGDAVISWKDNIDWDIPLYYCTNFGANQLVLVNTNNLDKDLTPICQINRVGRIVGASQETMNHFNYGGGNGIYNHVFDAKGCALGDSVTAGVGTDESNPWQYSWPTITQGMCGCVIQNLGFGGSRLTNTGEDAVSQHSFINRMTQILDDRDFIVVMGGLNDYFNDVELGVATDTGDQTVCGAINTILTYLINRFPTKCVMVALPFVGYEAGRNGAGYSLAEMNEVWKERCKYYSVPCFDMNKEGGMGYRVQARTNAYYPETDRTHPNKAGQRHIGKVMANFIKRHYTNE